MTAIPFPNWQTDDNSGSFAVGGKIYFWAPGTSTPRTTYSDTALTTPNTNPVLLNASGWPATTIYLDSSLAYEYEVKSADDAYTFVARKVIPVGGGSGAQPLDDTLTAIAALVIADDKYIQGTGADTFRVRYLQRSTYAQLTAITESDRFDGMRVWVSARTTAGDGGDGWWRFDSASSTTANGGTILAPDAGSGRWIRVSLKDGKISLRWFGTDATALQAAFDYMETDSTISKLFIPNGTYTIASTCTYSQTTLGRSITIEGEDMLETILEYTGSATNGMLAFVLGTAASQRANRLVVRNLAMTTAVANAGAAIKSTRTASATVAPNALFEDIYFYQTGGGYWTYDIWSIDASDQWFNRLYGMNFGPDTTACIFFDNNLTTQTIFGAYFHECSFNGADYNIRATGQLESIYISDSSLVGAQDCISLDATSTTSGNPHLVVQGCHINGKRRDIHTIDWRAVILSANDIYAGVGTDDEAGSSVLLDGANHVSITGNKFEHAAVSLTRVHISLTDCSHITITGNNMHNATGAGIIMSGTTERVVISGNTIRGYTGDSVNAEGIYNVATGDDFTYSGNYIEWFATGILSNNDNNLYTGNLIKSCTKGIESAGGTNNRASGNSFVSVTTNYTGQINSEPDFRGCLLYLNAATLAHASGGLTVTFDTEAYDTDGFCSAPGTSITIPASLNGAKVRLTAAVQWAAGEDPVCTMIIHKNGSGVYAGTCVRQDRATNINDQVILAGSTANIVVATGDVFVVETTQSNAGSDSVNIRGEGRTWFQLEVVG